MGLGKGPVWRDCDVMRRHGVKSYLTACSASICIFCNLWDSSIATGFWLGFALVFVGVYN